MWWCNIITMISHDAYTKFKFTIVYVKTLNINRINTNHIMSRIVLDLSINGLELSGHVFEVRINGCTITQMNHHENQQEVNPGISFREFIKSEIFFLESCQRLRSAEIYKSVLHQFMLFRNDCDINVEDITTKEIKRFETHLRSRNLSLNTISFYMRALRSCYNKAINKHQIKDRQPFNQVYTGIQPTNKRAIDISSIKAIRCCKLIDEQDCFARDMFMFSFFTRGMSFVDMAYLKHKDIRDGYLHYKRHKTGQSISVKWESCMQEIIDRYQHQNTDYLLPIIRIENGKERNQYRGIQHKINQRLKHIAVQCGLKTNLSMYVARHSWANAAKDLNHPLELISYGMGHTSTKTTKIYLRNIEMTKIDQMNTKILQEIELG